MNNPAESYARSPSSLRLCGPGRWLGGEGINPTSITNENGGLKDEIVCEWANWLIDLVCVACWDVKACSAD